MAKDFAALNEKSFPVRQIAEFICSRMIWQDDPRECCTFIENTRLKGQMNDLQRKRAINLTSHAFAFVLFRLFIKELSEIVSSGHYGIMLGNQSNPTALVAPAVQYGLAHFSLVITFFFTFTNQFI